MASFLVASDSDVIYFVGNFGTGAATLLAAEPINSTGIRGMLAQDPVAAMALRMMATNLEFMAGLEKWLLEPGGKGS